MIEQADIYRNGTDTARLTQLCETLVTPGATIPKDADKDLTDALLRRDFDSLKLVTASWFLMVSNPQVRSFLERAWAADFAVLDQYLADGSLIAFYATPLMQALLGATPVPDLSFERLNVYLRMRLLEVALDDSTQPSRKMRRVAPALATQAYLTDYIYPITDREDQLLAELTKNVITNAASGLDFYALSVLAAYYPLKVLLTKIKYIPEIAGSDLEDLFRIQVDEPARELALRATIPTITAIEDPVSEAVQGMYEESPYPRWVAAVKFDPVAPIEFFNGACVGVKMDEFGDPQTPKVLFAGCGTGKVVVEESVLWSNAEVLALDLSLPSLAFGRRRAEELGIKNVKFARGDLLELPKLGTFYDYISCSGVLHHMSDPIAGWRALTDVCRPGGVIRICLYSEMARAPVRYAQSLIGDGRAGADVTTVKKIREELIKTATAQESPDLRLQEIFSALDMYTTSMCRDLLFHVQEHDFTIPKVAAAIEQLGLRFCGFVDPERKLLTKYRAFAPNDPDGLDLMSWHRFEEENPRVFAQMYDVMVQKPV